MQPFPVFLAYSSLAEAEPIHNKTIGITRISEVNIRFTGIIVSLFTTKATKSKQEKQ
jgi:hypothetical protein